MLPRAALGDSGLPPSTPACVLRKEGPGLTASEPGAVSDNTTSRSAPGPTPAGRKGSDSLGWQQPEYVESWLNNADNKRGWSGSQVRLTRLELTLYRTGHFRPLAPNPSTPPRAAPRDLGPRDLGRSRGRAALSRAISRYLGRSRGRAALSRAISERRSRGVTPAQKKEGPGWSHGAHEDVLARFSPPRPAPLGPVRRRPARRVPRPVTPTPARTAHLQPSRGYSCAHAGEPGGTPFPPPPTG